MSLGLIAQAIDDTLQKPIPDSRIIDICGEWYQPYYSLFYFLAHWNNGGIAVELGVDQGRGSAAFALGGCQTYGIDHTRKVGIDRLNNFGNFTFILSDSMPKPGKVPEEIRNLKIDFLHIDTEHSYSMAKAEFEAYQFYLKSPAVVFFDDLHAQENGVLQYFMELPYPKIQDDRLHPINGFGMILYE